LVAFPGAEGFGALATGGRGGEIYPVTSLADAGPGSFREAVSRPHRIVVFDVGGVIRLASNVSCRSDLTLLGQTAPGEGVALYGRSVSFSGATNVIVRYLRFREGIGGNRGRGSLDLAGGANMIFDHLSIEWGRWDCLRVTEGSHDITVQNCIIGQGIDPQRFGALVDSVSNITLSHNLWIDNKSRNPKVKGTVQYVNNVVYNWGVNGLVGGHSEAVHQLDAVGNYFVKGPSSNGRFAAMFAPTDHVFQRNNFADLDGDGRLDGHPVSAQEFADSGGNPEFASAPMLHPPVAVPMESAEAAWKKIADDSGCSLHRDAVDQRLIDELRSLGAKGAIIRSEAEVGGMAGLRDARIPAGQAHEGIPDTWLSAHGLNPGQPGVAQGDYNKDGYNNVEKCANELAGSKNLAPKPAAAR
jgi:pectate lyase